MRNEIKLNLDLFERSPHLCLRRDTVRHTHTRTHTSRHACKYTHAHTPIYTPLRAPYHVSAPPGKSGVWRQVNLQAHVYIHGLNLASFLSAAAAAAVTKKKRNVFNLHNPHLALSPRRNTLGKVGAKSGLHPFCIICFRRARAKHTTPVYVLDVGMRGGVLSGRMQRIGFLQEKKEEKKQHLIIFQTCTVRSNSGSCASQFEWEDGSCTQQMLCVY